MSPRSDAVRNIVPVAVVPVGAVGHADRGHGATSRGRRRCRTTCSSVHRRRGRRPGRLRGRGRPSRCSRSLPARRCSRSRQPRVNRRSAGLATLGSSERARAWAWTGTRGRGRTRSRTGGGRSARHPGLGPDVSCPDRGRHRQADRALIGVPVERRDHGRFTCRRADTSCARCPPTRAARSRCPGRGPHRCAKAPSAPAGVRRTGPRPGRGQGGAHDHGPARRLR